MKKLISVLLCAAMLISLMPAAFAQTETEEKAIIETDVEALYAEASAEENDDVNELITEDSGEEHYDAVTASGTCGDNLTWTYDGDTETLTISGTGPMWDFDPCFEMEWGSRPTPWMYRDIRAVVISEGVTSIGNHAFCRLRYINSITIPDSMTYIGWCKCSDGEDESIDYSTRVGRIYINSLDAWMKIGGTRPTINSSGGDLYLNGVPVSKLVIPEGTTEISGSAFSGFNEIAEVIIPNSVTNIDASAFFNCSSIKYVFYGGSKSEWNNIGYIFYYTYWYGDEEITNKSFIHYNAALGEHNADNGTVTKAATCISEGVKTYACTVCGELISTETIAKLPHSYKSGYCTVCGEEDPDNYGKCGDNLAWTFDETTGTLTISGTGPMWDYDYEEGENGFYPTYHMWIDPGEHDGEEDYGTWIRSVVISEGVTTIGDYAFYGCSGLTTAFYGGSESDWKSLRFSFSGNVSIHYNAAFGEHSYAHGACTVCGEKQPNIPGDINSDGKVNLKDAMALLKYVSGEDVEVNEAVLDVDNSGRVNLKDSTLLLKYVTGENVKIY